MLVDESAGRIMSTKSANGPIGNRTRGFPTCSSVSQQPRTWNMARHFRVFPGS